MNGPALTDLRLRNASVLPPTFFPRSLSFSFSAAFASSAFSARTCSSAASSPCVGVAFSVSAWGLVEDVLPAVAFPLALRETGGAPEPDSVEEPAAGSGGVSLRRLDGDTWAEVDGRGDEVSKRQSRSCASCAICEL